MMTSANEYEQKDVANASEYKLLSWFANRARPFLEKHAKDRVAGLQNDGERLERLLSETEEVTICFLGNSGIGKSTLLNALAAGHDQLLPAGGIGPLTAQATRVHYSETPEFCVKYHAKAHLWRLGFVLEAWLKREPAAMRHDEEVGHREQKVGEAGPNGGVGLDLEEALDEETRNQELAELEPSGDNPEYNTAMDARLKQAKQIITGDQYSERLLPYLVDGIRLACGYAPQWGAAFDAGDQSRIDRIGKILGVTADDEGYVRKKDDGLSDGTLLPDFSEDLRTHVAGFLSPLIKDIAVGWPSELLKTGVILVDLPGVGIAKDAYRDVTKRYVKEKARAVILVVDRAGPTESTIETLRSSGFWDRLIGAADDPESDPCSILIAVTRVDDLAVEERQRLVPPDGMPRPKKEEVFVRIADEIQPRVQAQIRDQLAKIGESSNEAVQVARKQVIQSILDSLEIHPVSAPEFRKLRGDDEDDRAFLTDEAQTGIPRLRESLAQLARKEKKKRKDRIRSVSNRFSQGILNELHMIEDQWRTRTRADNEAAQMAAALEAFLGPKKNEYALRSGAFREFLENSVQVKIQSLVLEARIEAQAEVSKYLQKLRGVHWGTLKAAVVRGGSFYGSRHINLPDDIADLFQEPMAAVWGQKLLRDIRTRTSDYAGEIMALVSEVCQWASDQHVNADTARLLERQKSRTERQIAQMRQVGSEAVSELRKLVKVKLKDAISQPIKAACDEFVKKGDEKGLGVKNRILDLFESLAAQATGAAQKPATKILRDNFVKVREEIQTAFGEWGDPLQGTADLIVERVEERAKRSDAQKRGTVLAEWEVVMAACPMELLNREMKST